jgi:hypothetical protein
MSESLEGNNADQKRIEEWLLKHEKDLEITGENHEFTDGATDTISEYTYANIIAKTGNKDLLTKTFDISFTKDNGKGLIDHRLFAKDYPSYMRNRKMEIAQLYTKKFGLDESVVGKWQEAKKFKGLDKKGKKTYRESYPENISAAIDLEKKQPGAAKQLHDRFGIANFARYDSQMLVNQLETADQDLPYGVVAFPEADHNGAFFQDAYHLKTTADKLDKGGYVMRVIETGSQMDLARKLNGFHKRYAQAGNKIDFLLVGGHGSPESVNLGYNEATPPPLREEGMTEEKYQAEYGAWERQKLHDSLRTTIVKEDFEEGNGRGIKRAGEKWLSKDAPVVLISCSTGKEGGIAQTASKKLETTTVGPDRPTAVKKINVVFNNQGKPTFAVDYEFYKDLESDVEKAETMQYSSGKRV